MNDRPGIVLCCVLLTFLLNSFSVKAVTNADTTYHELWYIDTLENIGGHPTTIIGNPQVVSTDQGRAVMFDGDGDMLLVDANPLGDTKEFTIEIIFKPAGAYPQNIDPRFVHIQDPDDPFAKRVMIELRITAENTWYLDGFMITDNASLTLIDESLTHPTGQWMHAAVTYQNNVFKTYVNGIEELSGNVTYTTEIVATGAKTSLGARMNQRNWYNGIIRAFKITHRVLSPDEFLSPDTIANQLDMSNESGFTIYPNPANQYITVKLTSAISACCIKIFNVTGEVIYRKKSISSGSFSHQIATSWLPEGIYLVEVCAGDCYHTGRLIIQR